MAYQLAPKDAPVIYVVIGHTSYEESVSLAAAPTQELANEWARQYEAKYPEHWFDAIHVSPIELIQG